MESLKVSSRVFTILKKKLLCIHIIQIYVKPEKKLDYKINLNLILKFTKYRINLHTQKYHKGSHDNAKSF